MYTKVLVPLDGSREAELVFDRVREEIDPGGEVIFLRVVPHFKTRIIEGHTLLGSDQEEAERANALSYLRGFVERLGTTPFQLRAETVVSDSVAQGIADFARREGVDLIAMYTHGRRGLARLLKGSVAQKVQQLASTQTRVFRPQELRAEAVG